MSSVWRRCLSPQLEPRKGILGSTIARRFTVATPTSNDHPLFRHYQLANDVWMLEEKFFISWNRANIFFIRGTKRDLLVDTGTGIYNLSKYLLWSRLRESPEKPLVVAITHSHFDHSGGAFQFSSGADSIYIHKSEQSYLKNGSSFMTVAWITPQEVVPKPLGSDKEFSAKDYKVYPITSNLETFDEGDRIDLGDKSFKVLHLPGHSTGSVGLIGDGILVTGDTLYQTEAELIDWYPGSSVYKMYKSVEKLASFAERKEVELALPGHNDPLSRDEILQAAERHLKTNLTSRRFRKSYSRFKTNIVFSTHSLFRGLPESAREWTFS